MAKQVVNLFTQYEWESVAEETSGNIFTSANLINIQNKLALAATERAGLAYDVDNPHATLQREAALKGEMNAYQLLLDNHYSTLRALSAPEDSIDDSQSF